jgi:serine/threonine-protein phosphatase PGAM5
MGKRIICLVRHGQYVLDDKHRRSGLLTPLGQKQAHRTGKRLVELPFTKIYHSDIPRAKETAEIISSYLPSLPLHSTRLLREVVMPVGKAHRHFFGKQKLDYGESTAQTAAFMERFFKPVRSKTPVYELFVAHGNLIRYLTRMAVGDKPEGWLRLGTMNCGITVLAIGKSPDDSFLLRYNDIGHLPFKMQTGM